MHCRADAQVHCDRGASEMILPQAAGVGIISKTDGNGSRSGSFLLAFTFERKAGQVRSYIDNDPTIPLSTP